MNPKTLIAFLVVFVCGAACSASQIQAERAKAKACGENPALQRCVADVAAACEVYTCSREEAVLRTLKCLKVCEQHDAGEAGAAGE
jgi:hypothetical protein